MASKLGNGPELTSLEIQDLAERLDVSTPIMSYRVVGERVELHLLGGGVAIGSLDEKPTTAQLVNFTAKELRKIAVIIKIPGAAKLRKSELLAALADIEPRILVAAITEARL